MTQRLALAPRRKRVAGVILRGFLQSLESVCVSVWVLQGLEPSPAFQGQELTICFDGVDPREEGWFDAW